MPLEDYPWAETLHDLDLPTYTGFRYIEISQDDYDGGDILWLHVATVPQYGFYPENEDERDTSDVEWWDEVPDYFILDLRHPPTYATMCEVLADLMGHEGSVAEISRDNVLSNYPQFWTVAIPRGPVGVTIHHLHHTDGLETREEALAFALRLYQDGDPAEDLIDAEYEDEPQPNRMALLMEEE